MSKAGNATFEKGRKDGKKGNPMSVPKGEDHRIYEAGYFVGQQEKKRETK